jgi:hypothetical protein
LVSLSLSFRIGSVNKAPAGKPRQRTLPYFSVNASLGVTLVGFYMLFGACLVPINIYAHAPAFLMGFRLSGWQAGAFFAVLCLLDAAIGFHLLTRAPWSRMAAICFFAFRIANTLATFAFPVSRAHFEQAVLLTQRAMNPGAAPEASRLWLGAVTEIGVMTAAIWFLGRNRAAFLPAGSVTGRQDG